MRIPKVVLNRLTTKAKNQAYVFERLYRNLYNQEFYYEAHKKFYENKGNINGENKDILDDMTKKRIENLITKLKTQTYQPDPIRRTSIAKSNGKTKGLSIVAFEDQLVQEVVRRLLESIYEPQFSVHSHGFRTKLSCHTALKEIRDTFTGTKWFIKADIQFFFENIDHHVLISILRRKVHDERLINLIWKFLRAGYVGDGLFHKMSSGVAREGILGPLLSNIYLNELDRYVEIYIKTLNKGKTHNLKYYNFASKIPKGNNSCADFYLLEAHKQGRLKDLKMPNKELQSLGRIDTFNLNYHQLKYVRYVDTFMLGVIGSKKEVWKIIKTLKMFLKEHLKLELQEGKSIILHSSKNIRFLDYEIRVVRNSQHMQSANRTKQRNVNNQIKLFVPYEKYIQKLVQLNALKIGPNSSWKSVHRPYLVHKNDLEIIRTYNEEIEDYYNYYRLASNRHVLHSFRYIMKYSMIKTYAKKYKSTVSKIIAKHNVNGEFCIRYETKAGLKIACFSELKIGKVQLES